MSLPRLVFEWAKLFSCLSSVFLSQTFPHVLLVIFSEVFFKPCGGLYSPGTSSQAKRTGKPHKQKKYKDIN